MLNRALPILIFVAGALLALPDASAQDRSAEIRGMLQERDAEIKQLVGARDDFTAAQREQLKEVVNSGIDFEAMGRASLGPHWKDLTQSEKDEFIEVFSEIVRSQSLSNLDIYRARVTYDRIDVAGDSAFVATTTVYKDVPTPVDYVLGYQDDKWRVHDIILDDVSTAEGYARSFQSVVRKRGFETLMESLRKKLAKINS